MVRCWRSTNTGRDRQSTSLYRAMWETFKGPVPEGRKVFCLGEPHLENLVCAPFKGQATPEQLEPYMIRPGIIRDTAPIKLIGKSGAITAQAVCGHCSHVDIFKLPASMPAPEKIRKHFINLGWQITKKMKCPYCLKKENIDIKEKKGVEEMNNKVSSDKLAQTDTNITNRAAIAQPTEGAKKVKRLVFQVLEDAYDDVNRRYRPDWNDDRVAKETGAAVEFVRATREADFGPIGPPDEIEAIRLEVDAISRELRKVTDSISAVYKRNGWSIIP